MARGPVAGPDQHMHCRASIRERFGEEQGAREAPLFEMGAQPGVGKCSRDGQQNPQGRAFGRESGIGRSDGVEGFFQKGGGNRAAQEEEVEYFRIASRLAPFVGGKRCPPDQ
jgi:hypothetical protein